MGKVLKIAILAGFFAVLQACATANVNVSHQAPAAPPKFVRVAVPAFENGVGPDLPATAPDNVAGAIISTLQKERPGLFQEVSSSQSKDAGELVLRGKILSYNGGSKAARFLLIGLGAGKLELEVALVNGDTGETVERFSTSGSIVAGGVAGATMGIDNMVNSAARKIVERLAPYGSGGGVTTDKQ